MAEIDDAVVEEVDKELNERKAKIDSLVATNNKAILPTPVASPVESPEGSLFMANFRLETSAGGILNSRSAREYDPEKAKDFNFARYVPSDLLDYADRFALDMNEDQIKETEELVRKELADKQLMAEHPWKTFFTGIPAQIIDPINLLPGGQIYKSYKFASRVSRAVATGVTAGVASASLQEVILQEKQLTREIDESALNIVASGILAGAMGGVATGVSANARLKSLKFERAKRDIVNVLTDNEKKLKENGTLTDDDLLNMNKFVQKGMKIGPLNQLITSPFKTAKSFASSAFSHNYDLQKNLTGNSNVAPVERQIQTLKRSFTDAMRNYQNEFFQMNGVESGPFKKLRSGLLQDAVMSFEQFDDAVSLVLTSGEPHNNNHVNQAASILRNKVFDPLSKQAQELGLLPEGVSPKNAQQYFTVVYNKQKIIEQRSVFYGDLLDKFRQTNEKVKSFRETPEYAFIEKSQNSTLEAKKTAKAELTLTKKKVEELKKAQKDGKPKTKQLKAAMNKVEKLKDKIKQADENLKLLKDTVVKSVDPDMLDEKGLLRKVKSEDALRGSTTSAIDTILGRQDGKMLNPIMDVLSSTSSKPLKERKMLIDQVGMRDWHVTSASKVADMYVRGMAPHISLVKKAQQLGFTDVPAWTEAMANALKTELEVASRGKSAKEIAKLNKQFEKDSANIKDTFNLLKGVYGDGPNVLNDSAAKYHRMFLQWNSIRLLGAMTLSSIPDIGLQIFTHGPFKFIFDGLIPALRDFKQASINKKDINAIGYGIETEMGTRLKAFSEHEGLSTEVGPFSRAWDGAVDTFGNASLMNQWNDLMSSIAGHLSINRTLDTIADIKEGRAVKEKDLKRLGRLNIPKSHWDVIYSKTKNNIDTKTGARYADWGNWTIKDKFESEVLFNLQSAVGQEIDSIVIIPGLGDKPLSAHTPIGKVLFQFKTFLMASTNKVLFAGLQRRDADTFLGVLSMLALGSVSYMATSLAKDKEPDLSFENLALESIDRSGVLGIFMEVYNIGSKFYGPGVSRYNTRGIAGAFLGPSIGAAEDVTSVIQSITGLAGDKDFTTKDAEKLLRLAPYQNLFWLYRVNRAVTNQVALNLGATDKRD